MSDKLLATTLVAALAVETIGAVDPFGPGKVYLPAPRRYLATWLLWFVLGLASATGAAGTRLAGHLSLLVLLTMVVIGPFGRKVIGFLDSAGRFFPVEQGGSS